jgi:hypothetical protein
MNPRSTVAETRGRTSRRSPAIASRPSERNAGKRVDSRATKRRLLMALRRLLDHGHCELTLHTVAWNSIYDPREILDLRRTLRWTRGRIEQGLLEMLLGAVRGYAGAAPDR